MHVPDQAPQEYIDRYNFAYKPRNTFAGMLTCLDDAVKNITTALDDKGAWDNTLFVFTNGEPSSLLALHCLGADD